MELKDFVVQTISSLVDAVDDLQGKYESKGAIVNPPSAQSGSDVLQMGSENYTFRRVQNVQFDVAVTVSSETSGGGNAGIKVLSVELGGGAETAKSSSQISHVKFEVPIAFGASDVEQTHQTLKSKRDKQGIQLTGQKLG